MYNTTWLQDTILLRKFDVIWKNSGPFLGPDNIIPQKTHLDTGGPVDTVDHRKGVAIMILHCRYKSTDPEKDPNSVTYQNICSKR